MKIINIKHKYFNASILKQGAQIIHFEHFEYGKILWHTDMSYYEKDKPFRGVYQYVGHGLERP